MIRNYEFKIKINPRGEIATILTLISVGLMLMGVVVDNVAVKHVISYDKEIH